MISVVCWRWAPKAGYRSTYPPGTVNALRQMVARHYPHPHRFVCVTDNPAGIDPEVTIIPDFRDFAKLPSPHGSRNPSCYRRLRLYHPDAAQWFGERFVSLDLDTVITGDVSTLWNRPDDIVLWGDTNPTTFYNGSMVLMTAGVRRKVWDDFEPARSPALAKASGQFGSDQGWISYSLGKGEAIWTKADGVYSYRNDLSSGGMLPSDARVVFFHGRVDPWQPEARRLSWVREHYPEMAQAS